MSKKIIAIIGMAGSGKSEVVRIIERKYNLPKVYFGQVVMDELACQNLEVNPQNEQKVREELRAQYGMGVCAIKSLDRITEALETSDIVIVESLYSWEEYKILREKYQENYLNILIHTSPQTRFARLQNRKVRPIQKEEILEKRDYSEIENINKGGPIAMADFVIVNESDLEYLENEIDKVMGEIKNNF